MTAATDDCCPGFAVLRRAVADATGRLLLALFVVQIPVVVVGPHKLWGWRWWSVVLWSCSGGGLGRSVLVR